MEKTTESLRHEYMAVISGGEEDVNLKRRLLKAESETEGMLAVAIKRGKREQRWRKAKDFSF